ncbi:MAG TPA: helix-hairpin-helix domain-containing protein, partial [Leptolyngbyaceae cyanobacterium]
MTFTAPRPISKTALTTIKGIGPAKALRLQHALQIESVEELLQFSLEEIHDRLAVEGPAIPLREIRQWLAQAQALVVTITESETEQAETVPLTAT